MEKKNNKNKKNEIFVMQLIYKLKYHICELEINIYHEYFQDKNIRI